MTHRVLLFRANTPSPDIPIWWRNFIRECSSKFSDLKAVNEETRKYNATFSVDEDDSGRYIDRWLEFDSEEDATMFILRWS